MNEPQDVSDKRIERELLGKVASAARKYIRLTTVYQDIDSWRELLDALQKLDEHRDANG